MKFLQEIADLKAASAELRDLLANAPRPRRYVVGSAENRHDVSADQALVLLAGALVAIDEGAADVPLGPGRVFRAGQGDLVVVARQILAQAAEADAAAAEALGAASPGGG